MAEQERKKIGARGSFERDIRGEKHGIFGAQKKYFCIDYSIFKELIFQSEKEKPRDADIQFKAAARLFSDNLKLSTGRACASGSAAATLLR